MILNNCCCHVSIKYNVALYFNPLLQPLSLWHCVYNKDDEWRWQCQDVCLLLDQHFRREEARVQRQRQIHVNASRESRKRDDWTLQNKSTKPPTQAIDNYHITDMDGHCIGHGIFQAKWQILDRIYIIIIFRFFYLK